MKSVYLFNMKGKKLMNTTKGTKPMLNIRPRLIYARLAPLRRPVTAMRLEKMLGGLVYRQTISAHLQKLEKLGLVRFVKEEKRRGGWVALEPAGEMASEFVRLKETPEDGRWHGCFASWRLPLPAKKPFPGARNATELYAAYWLIRNLEIAEGKRPKPGKVMKVKRIAALLGVAPFTARKIVMTLRDEGLIDGDRIAPHRFILQQKEEVVTKTEQIADDGDSLDIRVNRLKGKKAIHGLVRQLTRGNYMLRRDLYKVAGDALKEHKKNGLPGDGSALVLSWLGGRLRTRQGIEDGESQKVLDNQLHAERQAEAIARLEMEVEEERRSRPNVYEVVAAKFSPGENIKANILGMLYTEGEIVAAWPRLEGRSGLTTSELAQIVRPKTTNSTKAMVLGVPSAPEGRRTPEHITLPTAGHDEDDVDWFDFDTTHESLQA